MHDDHTHRLSKDGQPLSTFFGQSSFGTFAIAHERNVVKVDKDVDLALLGPLGCGIQTGAGTVLNKMKPEFGSTIAIYGAGAVGLSAIMAAKIVGCKTIIAVDVHDSRLELAKELGATHTFNGTKVDVVKEIKELTNGGTKYAVDTTGVPPVVRQCLQALRPLGTAAIVGVTPEMNIDVHNDIMAEGKTMMGVIEGDAVPNVFIPQLVEYYKAGQFPFDKLVKFFDFDQLTKLLKHQNQAKQLNQFYVFNKTDENHFISNNEVVFYIFSYGIPSLRYYYLYQPTSNESYNDCYDKLTNHTYYQSFEQTFSRN